ncbi:MFS general substrate transporter [Trametes punicea]|nr:MFS general substrate transporter [Trametes punicea]
MQAILYRGHRRKIAPLTFGYHLSTMLDAEASAPDKESLERDITVDCLEESPTTSNDSCRAAIFDGANIAEECRIWRQVDLRLIPLVTVMYLVAFIDKTNIGNAKLQGLTTQLDLTGNRFNILLTVNFIANCIFALPANLLLKKFRPSIWLPGITIVWGIIMTLQGIVKTYPQLLALRICLGLAEAGLSPGILYYLTLWYPRFMLQYRIGLFWGGAAFAGAFSGLLAYGISFMSGTAGLLGWSWIFIIEGLISVVVGVIAYFLFVDYPHAAKFLTAGEKEILIHRQAYDRSFAAENEEFAVQHILDALLDWQVWAACLIEMSITIPIYGISLFLPSIINGFGFGPAISQLLSIPPYVVATTTMVLWAACSDRLKARSPFIVLGLLLCLVGFAVNISDGPLGVKYFGTFLVVTGSYGGFPGVPSWLGNNLVDHCKRGTGIAVQAIAGQIGGIIASNIYRTQDAPRYVIGHIVEIAFVGMGLLVVPFVAFIYARINARRNMSQDQATEKGSRFRPTSETRHRLGDQAPEFRYSL